MFEKVVESILVEYVSEWVEGLDAEKMKIALFGGKVEVRELKLKTAALDKFQLPLRVKAGTLGRLALKVPWKRLTKESVKLVIEDVFLMVVPAHQDEMQRIKNGKSLDSAEDSYELRLRFAKQQEIRVRELLERSKNDDGRRVSDADDTGLMAGSNSPSTGDTTSGWGYREKILHNILDNVSVEVKNVHIRYEDTSQMLARNPFAIGVTIQSISVNTTNANGHVTFVDRAQSHTPFVHKILEVAQIGLYCDGTDNLQELMSERRQRPPLESYIIHPFNVSAKMTVNHDESTLFSIPRLQFVADVGSILASVTESQCNDVISAVNFISTHETYLKRIHIRKKRPKVPVKRDAKSWWMYALYGVQILYGLESRRRSSSGSTIMTSKSRPVKCSWRVFGERWMQRKEYITLQKKMLKAVSKKLPPESLVGDKMRMTDIEDELDVETIVFYRLCAEHEHDLEGNRHDSVKKLSWKARWKSVNSDTRGGAPSVLRRLDPLERLLLYNTICEQMNKSSTALAAKEQAKLNSKAILYALDLAVKSFTFSLVEPGQSMPDLSSGLNREFLRFEMNQFVFAIFQRASACAITSSIQSIQMLDYSNPVRCGSETLEPQPLFYSLTPNSARDDAPAEQTLKFVELSIDATESSLRISCTFQPFRYIHHLAVAAKLQGYFVIQVEVAPELMENAEEALASSSVWLNNAVFSKPPPAALRVAEKQRLDSRSKDLSPPGRVVDITVVVPIVDVFVLSSETSPILEIKLTELVFRSKNLTDSFEFAIDGVEVTFIDGVIASSHETKLSGMMTNKGASTRTSSYYDLTDRKRSAILRKARIVFTGEKTLVPSRLPCWVAKCTAPPIYFTLSSAQYQQVVQASAAWAASAKTADRHPKLVRQSAKANVTSKPRINTPRLEKTHTKGEEFDANEERFGLCVHIPHILIVLEGGGGMPTEGLTPSSEAEAEDSEIDLVLDLRVINLEAKFYSSAQAIAADFQKLLFFKRKSNRRIRHDSHGNKVRLTTAEAISQVNKSNPNSRTSSLNEQPPEPDPAYSPETGEPSNKLVEIGHKATFVASSMDPLKGSLRLQQLALYWDHDLLIALFRSYLWGNSIVARSAPSSSSSSRTSSRNSAGSQEEKDVPLDDPSVEFEGAQLSLFSLEVNVDKWFVFMRPSGTVSSRFALKMHGKDFRCGVSTLGGLFTQVHVHAKNGLFLESSRFVHISGQQTGGEDVCELLQTRSMSIDVESAACGVLSHRTGAATYVSVMTSAVELNYVHAHMQVLFDHLNKQIIGFFNWVSIQLQPLEVKTVNARTKVEVSAEGIKILLPRGPVGNAIERERKPERMELDLKRLVISSRPYPKDVKFEQLLIRAEDIQLASFLVDTTRSHTDAVGSVDEAVARAQEVQAKNVLQHATALSKTTVLAHQSVFVDHVSTPIPSKRKRRKPPCTEIRNDSEDKATKPKRPLDLEDVAKEMQNYCSFLRVFLTRPDDWGALESSGKRPRLNIQTGSCIMLAVEKQQIELLMCLMDENFGRLELLPSGFAHKEEDDEKQVLDVQVMVGDVSLGLLRPSRADARFIRDPNAVEGVSERVVGRIDLEGVNVSVAGFASSRGQQRIVASRARFWKIDAVTKHSVDENGNSVCEFEHHEVECGELFLTSQDSGLQCIDVTLDQQGQQAAGHGHLHTTPPLEIRIHVDTCALLPTFLTLMTRLMPFFTVQPRFPYYEKKKGNPISVSVTTGMVHCMLAQHQAISSDDNNLNATPLNLIISGCAVVRYTDGATDLKHIQVFGRKMSLETSGRWPPLPESTGGMVAPSPCSTPTYPASPSQVRGLKSSESTVARSNPMVSLAEYRRVLCDDFAIDLDLVDTLDVDETMKISASLTHVHAVLCTFDLLMLSKVQALIDSIANEAIANPSRPNSRTNSREQSTNGLSVSVKNVDQAAKHTIVNLVLEDVSLTFVREIGEYFSPLARMYSFCVMCNLNVDAEPAVSKLSVTAPPQTVHVRVFFTEDTEDSLRDDEGLSIWAFNAVLGSWEPIIEPWTFELALRLQTDGNGKASTKIDITGSNTHSLNANFSPRLLDTFCAIARELEPFNLGPAQKNAIPPATASVISCGFYLANDTGVSITYWVRDHTTAPTNSRGFTYAPRLKHQPEELQPLHKVPLKLSTAILPSLPNDQTISFSWGDEEWHPLTDVRIHSAGKYIYSVLPKATSRTNSRDASSSSGVKAVPPPKVLLALFDISSVFGYRTLTVSSLVRVFNETDVPVACALLGDDGKSVTEFGVLEPHSACGVPITLIRSVAGIRLLVRPHRPESSVGDSRERYSEPLAGVLLGSNHVQTPVWEKEHRWSNELLISDKEECVETVAACSLVLDDFDCRCQRMFDGSQPLHVSQICRSNGSFFRAWNRVFVASNGNNLKYAQLRVLPTLTFENKCAVPIFIVVFVFKRVRRAGITQDREYSHIVASERVPARDSLQFFSSSLQESTFCSISMTGFSWSKLFRLPNAFDTGMSVGSQPENSRGASGMSAILGGAAAMAPGPSPAATSKAEMPFGEEILCSVKDFKNRKASINVILHGSTGEQLMRRVVIQPKYLIRNESSLNLTFEPSTKSKSRLPATKSFFSLPSPSFSSKQGFTCCGSSQLETIHTKLNALHGATTTSASPQVASSKGKSGPIAGDPTPSAQETDDSDHFYCSETNMINVQIEGNTLLTSGVMQFRLDAAVGGTNSTIRLFDESKQHWHDMVVILEQVDAFTTKATFVYRYIFLNRTDLDLLVIPAGDIMGSTSQDPLTGSGLKPHSSTPYHWSFRQSVPSDPTIRVKVSDPSVTGWRWSGKFSLHDVSECAFKLSNKYTSQVHTIRVEVRVESSVRVFVLLSCEDNAPFPLYRVINSSAHEIIHFKQSFEGGSGELSEQAASSLDYSRGVTQRLFPGESSCFGWDEGFFLQSIDRVMEISYTAEAVHTKVMLDQPGEAQRIELPATMSRPATSVYVHWYLNGVTKTVHVHDTQLPRDKLTGKLNVDAIKPSRGITPVISEIALELKMPNMMLSILNSTPEEVLLFTAENLDFKYASTRGQHDEVEIQIGSFQLDNQLSNAVFPVVFTPIPLTSSASSSTSPPSSTPASPMVSPTSSGAKSPEKLQETSDTFFHMSIFRLSYGDDVDYLKYMSAMIQPARVQVDDFLIISVALLSSDCLHVIHRHYPTKESHPNSTDSEIKGRRLTRSLSGNSGDNSSVGGAEDHETGVLKKIPASERRMYIETLELHPFKLQVTFQQNNLSKAPLFDDGSTNFLLPVVFMILKSNLVNIDSAAINLNALHIYHSFTTKSFMLSAIQQHYAFQGILQMYSLLGSADILGNPLGLVKNLGTGVKDFFYEPMAGMVKSPQEFVFGLSRGTASLVKNSVYGTFNAASRFTGTLSSGIAALSMDGDYIKARNTRNRQEVATHIGTGLYYGTKQLGQGIIAGVSGVITAPALGAYNNGLTGFVEGIGKGLIGVAVKPTAGILDLAARTTAGITATATVFDKKARDTRMRLPRMMHTSDKRLRVYSMDEAMISQLLHRLPQKLLRNEHYEAHVFIPVNRAVVATSHQFFHVDFSSITGVTPGHPRITWRFPLSSVWGAQKSAKGVNIFIGSASNVSVASMSSSANSAPPSPSNSPSLIHPPQTTSIQSAVVTKSSMTTVLIPMKETDGPTMDRLVKCVSDLVARQRERAPVTETFASPLPRNSIGMVLEPVRDSNKVSGYEGYGGRVVDVFVGSACYRAGVEVGDIIVGFGSQKFEAGDHGSALRTQLSTMRKGDTLELMVLRHGAIKHISVVTE